MIVWALQAGCLIGPIVAVLMFVGRWCRRQHKATIPAIIEYTGPDIPIRSLPWPVNFATLRLLNHDRISSFGQAHSPAGLVACIAEEHGEVAACVLGLTGEKKRKAHLTIADLGHELADVVTYCDLLADQYGIDLGEAVREKFNIVSARVGYGKVWQ